MTPLAGRARVLVVGSGGAGKSTFARALGERTGLPVVHLDAHHWRPGWVAPPVEEWNQTVAGLIAGERWIIDGNYGGSLSMRIARCDAIVVFDLPTMVCLWGAVKRSIVYRGRPRPDMAPGCPERLDREFLRWVVRFRRDSRPRLLAEVAAAPPDVEEVVIRRRRDARKLLESFDANGDRSGGPPRARIMGRRR